MKKLIFSFLLLFCFYLVMGQKRSVVIGTFVDKPNAILVINPPNGDQGFLLPQLTSAQRLSVAPISPDDDGLIVYDITEQSFYYWSGSQWIKGLGEAGKTLSYDAASQILSLGSSGGSVDLSSLKEIPTITGNGGSFLTTDGTTLSWAKIATLGDITGVIPGPGLVGGGTTGDATIAANPDGTTISINATNQLQLTDGGVTGSKIQPGASDQVMVTNNAGNGVQWATRGGDVSGAIGTTTVARIQGRDVSNVAPNTGDALIWNGTAWVPGVVTPSPTTQFYGIDPSAFEGLEPGGNNNPILGIFQSNNTFVTAIGDGREIMAPINIPDGASIQNVTVSYVDNELLGNVTVNLIRKPYAGTNQVLSTFTSGLVSLVIQSQNLPAVAAANRLIDNSTYTYRIHVVFQPNPLLPFISQATSNQRIHGVRIEYIK